MSRNHVIILDIACLKFVNLAFQAFMIHILEQDELNNVQTIHKSFISMDNDLYPLYFRTKSLRLCL